MLWSNITVQEKDRLIKILSIIGLIGAYYIWKDICKIQQKKQTRTNKKQKNEIKTAKKETELIIFKNGRYAIFTIYIIYWKTIYVFD